MLFKGKKVGLRRTAHLQSCCPSAEHARDPRKRAMPETSVSHQNKKPSAEFARSANNSNKIPPGGVYVGRD